MMKTVMVYSELLGCSFSCFVAILGFLNLVHNLAIPFIQIQHYKKIESVPRALKYN